MDGRPDKPITALPTDLAVQRCMGGDPARPEQRCPAITSRKLTRQLSNRSQRLPSLRCSVYSRPHLQHSPEPRVLLLAAQQDEVGAVIIGPVRPPPKTASGPPGKQACSSPMAEYLHGHLPVYRRRWIPEEGVGVLNNAFGLFRHLIQFLERLGARRGGRIPRNLQAGLRCPAKRRNHDVEITAEQPFLQPPLKCRPISHNHDVW